MTASTLKFAKNAPPLALLAVISMAASHAGASPGAVAPLQLQTIADIPLGGHPTRLDYASLDAGRHLLFIAHLGDSEVIVFDTEARRVVKRIANVSPAPASAARSCRSLDPPRPADWRSAH
jgi:hypothetical protein